MTPILTRRSPVSPIQALFLGILQGATEFLPVSSSGHLVIFPALFNWPQPSLAMDVVLHLGTLVAILIFFRRELWALFLAAWESLRARSLADPQARLAWAIALGTIPAALIGFLLEDTVEALFAQPKVAAGFLLGTAALLVVSELLGNRLKALDALSWRDALLIGLAQTLAILPGLSRSGATIAAGLLLGYRRDDAARFSFYLAVPIVLGGGLYQVLKIARDGLGAAEAVPMALGFMAAGVTGFASIAGLLALVRRRNLWPFAAYCALLGTLVLAGVLG